MTRPAMAALSHRRFRPGPQLLSQRLICRQRTGSHLAAAIVIPAGGRRELGGGGAVQRGLGTLFIREHEELPEPLQGPRQRTQDVGRHRPRVECVGRHPGPREATRQLFRVQYVHELGDGVIGEPAALRRRPALEHGPVDPLDHHVGAARHIDDPPLRRLPHPRQEEAREQEGPDVVGRVGEVEAVLGEGARPRDPGVVDQDVDRLAGSEKRLGGAPHRAEIRYIEGHPLRPHGRVAALDPGQDGSGPLLGARREHDPAAPRREGLDQRTADAGARSGDEEGPPFKIRGILLVKQPFLKLRHLTEQPPLGRSCSLACRSSPPSRSPARSRTRDRRATHPTRRHPRPASQPPVIDGRDDDVVWREAQPIVGFQEWRPSEGGPPKLPTEAKIAYDAGALYVFVRAFDPHPDSIITVLARRDYFTPSDMIWLFLDSYHDRRTGYEFGVNPSGVKLDAQIYNDGNEDFAWDAVWDVATQIDSLGWTAEFRIPLSQMRYGREREHTFGIMIDRD